MIKKAMNTKFQFIEHSTLTKIGEGVVIATDICYNLKKHRG